MTWTGLAWRWLWARPLSASLSLLLMTLGLGAVGFVLIVGEQVSQRLARDLQGVDLVVGAKGSPLQLILSAVLHVDVPTGNIPLASVDRIAGHPLVAQVIPVSLGDSLQGHRIVGTTPAFLAHHQARFAQGQAWTAPMQAVLGAEVARRTGLRLGDRFVGVHGLGRGGHAHEDTPFVVVGVLAPSRGVIDRLVLTDLASVWEVHEAGTAMDEEDRRVLAQEREVTALLLRYRSPLGAVSVPRWVQAQAELQAASPAVEVTRLLRLLGVGGDLLQAFGALLLATAALSAFIALYHAVSERQRDLAMLRLLGARARDVAWVVALQAFWLAAMAALLGLALAQGLTALLAYALEQQRSLPLAAVAWPSTLLVVPGLALAVAAVSATLPVWRAYRLEVGQRAFRS